MTIALTVDGHHVEVERGASVLDAVNLVGVALPQLCKDPDRPRLGTCRTCLVAIDGWRGRPPPAPCPRRREWPSAPTRRRSCAFAAGCCN